jgi:hypothetical protein
MQLLQIFGHWRQQSERVKATCGIELEEEVQLLDSGECGQ